MKVGFMTLLIMAMAVTFLGCPTDTTDDGPSSISWTIAEVGGSDSTKDSTAITITFSDTVSDLKASEVEVSGAAEMSGPIVQDADNGKVWTIPITVIAAGTAQVTITRTDKVVNGIKSVSIYKEGQALPNTWTVTANGQEGKVSTTELTFTFAKDVTNLKAEEITITAVEGEGSAVAAGAPTGGAKTWKLPVTVNTQGKVSINIAQDGIETISQTVVVHFNRSSGIVDNFTILPEKPVFGKLEDGYEFTDDVDLSNPPAAFSANQIRPTLAFNWTGAGATLYNLYWSDEAVRPANPNAEGITAQSYIINKGLEPETKYYIWVEAVNSQGSMISDVKDRTTRKSDIERGDYPRNIKVEPGNGSLTVWWDMPDRVGWHEIYYAKKGDINHVDVFTPIKFNYKELGGTPLNTAYAELSYSQVDDTWYNLADIGYPDYWASGYTKPIYPFLTPLAGNGGWEGYYFGKKNGIDGDTRPIIGVVEDANYASVPAANAFPHVFETWKAGDGEYDLPKLEPYTKLDARFTNAIPWDGTNAGTPGTPIRYYKNSVTITGLTNGETYEVWIRCPNINGERGYGYVVGTPGSSGVAEVSNITVTAPVDTTRDLEISWNEVTGAQAYRLYFSNFNQKPNAMTAYTVVADTGEASYKVIRNGLLPNTTYYVWVVAEQNGVAGTIGNVVVGTTGRAPDTGTMRDKLIAGSQNKVKTLVYVEVNDHNPLNAGSYILDDGTYLFDYVVLFAANIRNRNCAEEGGVHGCTKSGPHLHLNENVRHILTNNSKYIKPLQDKGIKVLLGLLGDHDGIGFGTMTDAEITAFITDVKADIDAYGLDGVDFDDEWASKEAWDQNVLDNNPTPTSIWTYPTSTWSWPLSVTIYRDPAKGVVAGNGTRTPPSAADMTRMWGESGSIYLKTLKEARRQMPDKIITLYEYNTGRYISPEGVNAVDSTVTMTELNSVTDIALQPWYNRYLENSANTLPRAKYSPFGMDVGGGAYAAQNGAPNPPWNTTGTDSVTDYATRYKAASDAGNPYGYLYFYGLNPASTLLKNDSNDAVRTRTKEEYLSVMSQIIFGKSVLLTNEGGDYRKDW